MRSGTETQGFFATRLGFWLGDGLRAGRGRFLDLIALRNRLESVHFWTSTSESDQKNRLNRSFSPWETLENLRDLPGGRLAMNLRSAGLNFLVLGGLRAHIDAGPAVRATATAQESGYGVAGHSDAGIGYRREYGDLYGDGKRPAAAIALRTFGSAGVRWTRC